MSSIRNVDPATPNTILSQLGGQKRLILMTGASMFSTGGNDLSFKVAGKHPQNGNITHIRITLTPLDVYDVEYLRIRGSKVTEVAKSEGIYCNMLKDDFEQNTQLYLTL